jgi:hypothetical protein
VRYIALTLFSMVILGGVLVGQTPDQNRRAQLASAVERRLEAQQPLDLSADSITLTGGSLRLKGHAHIVWLPDTSIVVEEVTIDGSRVQLIGDINASLGRSSGVPLPSPPTVDFR